MLLLFKVMYSLHNVCFSLLLSNPVKIGVAFHSLESLCSQSSFIDSYVSIKICTEASNYSPAVVLCIDPAC